MFSKVLIANRGLIQANCVRAVQELGAKAITIFEAEDKNSAGVRNSDEAYELKPTASSRAYADADQIVELAASLKVDAVHSGYGFLAQNAEFAKKLKKLGIVTIGPDLEGKYNLYDRPLIKKQALDLGLYILPGSEICSNYKSVLKSAESLGYPLLLKALHGYAGRGLIVVPRAQELKSSYQYVLNQCDKYAMNSHDIILEKFYAEAHHIEFPVLRDKNGNVVVFPEQWCSVQRRFQKVLVESPSRVITADKRYRLKSVIQRLVTKLNICGYASVVFLIQGDHSYFLRVNGYIQPFYSATSLLTGIDILKEQIRIFSGESLKAQPGQLNSKGHVISVSICAEDPDKDFAPSPGRINRFYPPFGQGVTVQANVFSGDDVATYFDPMIAKVIVLESNRRDAIKKMKVALDNFFIDGIETNIPLLRAILNSREFKERRFNISFIPKKKNRKKIMEEMKDAKHEEIASMVAAIAMHYDFNTQQILDTAREISENSLWATASRWLSRKKIN